MKLVVGLGNPGARYEGTRHNVGFDMLDQLAKKLGWIASPAQFNQRAKSKFDGLALDGAIALSQGGEEKLLMLKPMTFMNRSGQSVQSACAFYQLASADVLIVLDDLALPVGRLRLRASGSSGGHNGLKDIERALGTNDYARLRIGIGAPPPPIASEDYVLGKFSQAERTQLDGVAPRVCGAIVTWIDKGIEAAMNLFNSEPTQQQES